ncbi:hypothetical protein ATI61_1041 [Archangium gephyra]|uniref:Lipoprotein n=1 Tax=Archangium gephyra TaxID=48 RepID=A0AAC8Q486_9BACT|nr:hypothetical protein [Archangium gephyra]AKJ00592.1 Hypothetical protein AA314_02218 [Archangium gephyra]REG32714.1 hypothetical protein ATI61_1041 [Archangium gephyra]
MHRARRLSGGLLLGLLLLGVAGCATTERQSLLERSAAQVAYRLPSEQLLEVGRELLKERGYLILESRDANYVRTSWKGKFDESLDIGGVRERHFILSKQLPDGRVVLNAYRASYTTIGRTAPHPGSTQTDAKTGYQMTYDGDPLSYARPQVVRDLELEWQILSKVAPSIASELETQVDEYLATKPK